MLAEELNNRLGVPLLDVQRLLDIPVRIDELYGRIGTAHVRNL